VSLLTRNLLSCLYLTHNTTPTHHPHTTNTNTHTHTHQADLVAQKHLEGRDEIDWRRNLLFATWGCLWLGGVQYFIYVHLFTKRLFPRAHLFVNKSFREKLRDREGQKTLIKQIALDQGVHHPFFLFPCFYSLKSYIENDGTLTSTQRIRNGLKLYVQNIREDILRCWAFWVPAFAFNFSVCPIWMRVPFVAGASFFWTMFWSFTRGPPSE